MKPAAAAAVAVTALVLPLAGHATAGTTGTRAAAPAPGLTVHRVGSVVDYHLDERLPSGQQLDSGTASVTYTCTSPAPGVQAVALSGVAVSDAVVAGGRRTGEVLTCDGRRHRQALQLSRGTGAPFTPPAARVRAQLRVTVAWSCSAGCPSDTDLGELPAPVAVTAPVTVVFTGF